MEYFLEVIGLFWWSGKITTHINTALGLFHNYPYIPKGRRLSVTRSIRIQLVTYFCIFAVSIYLTSKELTGYNFFLIFWLLPLAVGQPFLRMILLADHTACTSDSNFLTNTRTTYTHPLVRFLMWEMPFHAEHHCYPMIPFHALAKVHEKLKPHLEFVMIDGFIGAQRQIIENFPQSKK